MSVDVASDAEPVEQAGAPDAGPRPGRARRLVDVAVARPVLTVIVCALVLRVGLAIGSYVVAPDSWFVPDEQQYVELGDAVAHGDGAESWVVGYGESLYRNTYTFMLPVRVLFEVFPVTRLPGSLWSAVLGALTAGVTVALARTVVSRRWALLAGLVVAVMPSQVYWSSASIRESSVWLCLAGSAAVLALGAKHDDQRALRAVIGAGLVLLPVAWLRDQTLIGAAWAIGLWSVLAGRRLWSARAAIGLTIAIAVPAAGGLGPAGLELLITAFPKLGGLRTLQSMDAASGFTETTLVQEATTTTTEPEEPEEEPGGGPVGPTRPTTTTSTVPTTTSTSINVPVPSVDSDGNPVTVIHTANGRILVADESLSANLESLPKGLLATLVRPFPWERTGSTGLLLAKLENLAWYVLYALSAVGLVVAVRRERWRLGLPVIVVAAVVGIGAVSQGNLGTAFRHRGQVLWALAVLGAVGAQELAARRARRRTT